MKPFNWLTKFGRNGKAATPIEEDEPFEESKADGASVDSLRKHTRLLETVLFANPDAGTEFDDRFFTNLERGAALDLPVHTQKNLQRLSLLAYRKNVRAFCAIELIKDFVIGDGVRFRAADPKVQILLDQHWKANQWAKKLEERVRALAIFGEQVYPVFVNEETGLVRLSSISPLNVQKIFRNPKDAEDLVRIGVAIVKEQTPGNAFVQGTSDTIDTKTFDLIRLTQNTGTLQGEVFFFAVNRVSGATRGVPDLSAATDWLEGLDGFIFSLMERAELSQDVVFDLEFEGLNGKELRDKAKKFAGALRAGGVWAHNERAKLKIEAPDLGGSDAEIVASILMRQIQAGTRLAGLFFGDSSDLTRSSASELSVPVAKAIQGRQNFIKGMFTDIFQFQIEQGVKAGVLNGVTDFSFTIEMAKVFLRDMTTVTAALMNLGNTLEVAVANGWVNNDQAGALYRNALEQLGAPVEDPVKLEESIPNDVQDFATALDKKAKEILNERLSKDFVGTKI